MGGMWPRRRHLSMNFQFASWPARRKVKRRRKGVRRVKRRILLHSGRARSGRILREEGGRRKSMSMVTRSLR